MATPANPSAGYTTRFSTALLRLQSPWALLGAVLVIALSALCQPFYESMPDSSQAGTWLGQRDWLIGVTRQRFWVSTHLTTELEVRIALRTTLLWAAGCSVMLAMLWRKLAGVGALGRCSHRTILQLVVVFAIPWNTWGLASTDEAEIFSFIPCAALAIYRLDRIPVVRVLSFIVVNASLLLVVCWPTGGGTASLPSRRERSQKSWGSH